MSVLADILNPAFAVNDAVRVILQSCQYGAVGKIICGHLSLLEQVFGVGIDKERVCDVLYKVTLVIADNSSVFIIAGGDFLRVERIGNVDCVCLPDDPANFVCSLDFTSVIRIIDVTRQFC